MVLDALHQEFRIGYLRELLYSNIVIVAESVEELCRKLTYWEVNLENKELRVNMKKKSC